MPDETPQVQTPVDSTPPVQPVQNTPPVQQPKFKSSMLMIIGLVVILIFAAFGGWYFLFQQSGNQKETKQTNNSKPEDKAEIKIIDVDQPLAISRGNYVSATYGQKTTVYYNGKESFSSDYEIANTAISENGAHYAVLLVREKPSQTDLYVNGKLVLTKASSLEDVRIANNGQYYLIEDRKFLMKGFEKIFESKGEIQSFEISADGSTYLLRATDPESKEPVKFGFVKNIIYLNGKEIFKGRVPSYPQLSPNGKHYMFVDVKAKLGLNNLDESESQTLYVDGKAIVTKNHQLCCNQQQITNLGHYVVLVVGDGSYYFMDGMVVDKQKVQPNDENFPSNIYINEDATLVLKRFGTKGGWTLNGKTIASVKQNDNLAEVVGNTVYLYQKSD